MSPMPTTVRSVIQTLAVLLLSLGVGGIRAQQRPLVVDDLLKFQQLVDAVPSPDGRWLAVVITRPRTPGETYRIMPYSQDVDHADIWLMSGRGGPSRNLTQGVADGSGYWNPVWSPDGRYIAMLSTKGADNIRPYVWDLRRGALRRVTEQGVDPIRSATERDGSFGMLWRDSVTLLVPVLARGEVTPFIHKIRSYAIAEREWAKVAKGVEPTVSVLESGREIPQVERTAGELLAVNVASGASRVLAKGNFRRLLRSPNGRYLALIAETGRIPPPPLLAIPDLEGAWRSGMAMLALDGGSPPVWVTGFYDPPAKGPELPHAWAPDGSTFAVLGKVSQADTTAQTLFLAYPDSTEARRVTADSLQVSAATWTAGGDLLARGRAVASQEPEPSRPDWWLVDPRKEQVVRRMTAEMETVPNNLFPTPFPDRELGLVDGELWAIDVSGRTSNLTAALSPKIEEIVWPAVGRRPDSSQEGLVLRGAGNALIRATWRGDSLRTEPLRRPTPNANLVAFDAKEGVEVYTAVEPNGTFLWSIAAGSRAPVRLFALNEEAARIGDPKRMLISYQGAEGDSLQALVVLPLGYEPGRRYPLVTWVHHGAEVLDTTFYGLLDKQAVTSLNRLLLPAHGYVLLIPSMPIPVERAGTDPYLDLPKNVLPAVDRAIQLGIADPARLGLMGHSYGGYSVFSLVTYTHRFTVAVAMAGPADLVSLYGTFPGSERYEANAHENLFHPAWAEGRNGQGQMYAPPWVDLWRYLRNSPLSFVERVRTPIMIVHGDVDYVPIQQGEEFFTALYRMGKEAKFVRYWGEGHDFESPANMRDLWQRIFAWLDDHFRDAN